MTEPVVIRPGRTVPQWLFRAYELIAPRLPRQVLRMFVRAVFALPRRSRARQWFVVALSTIGWEVTGRGRFDLILPLWDPTCEWRWDPSFTSLGFDEVYRGHDGVRRSVMQWNEVWSERAWTVREILDGGDTWVMRVTASGRGRVSGVPTEQDFSAAIRINPQIVYWHNFADDAEALREAGFTRPKGQE